MTATLGTRRRGGGARATPPHPFVHHPFSRIMTVLIGYNMEKVAIALLLLSFTFVRLAPTTIVAVWVLVLIFYFPTYSGSPSKTGIRSLSDTVGVLPRIPVPSLLPCPGYGSATEDPSEWTTEPCPQLARAHAHAHACRARPNCRANPILIGAPDSVGKRRINLVGIPPSPAVRAARSLVL